MLSHFFKINPRGQYANKTIKVLLENLVRVHPGLATGTANVLSHLFPQHCTMMTEMGNFKGAMPTRLLGGNKAEMEGFVSPGRDAYEKITNYGNTWAFDADYWAYAFMIEMLRLCEHSSATILVKRGMDHAICARNSKDRGGQYEKRFGDQILPHMPFDEADAQKKVRELAAMVKCRGNPTYFFTITCNQPKFPGLAQFHEALLDSGQDPMPWAPYLTRLWHRSTRLLLEWLTNDDTVMGAWTDLMWRHEFQNEKANLSHIHALAFTQDAVNDEDSLVRAEAFATARDRVTANIGTAFAYIRDPDHRASLEKEAWDLQRHVCGPNCQRPARDGSGEMECRLRLPKLPCCQSFYREVQSKVSDEVLDILVELELAEVSPKGRVDLHHELRGGEHHYVRGAFDHFVSPFVAEVFEETHSHMNVQVADNRFTHAYLMKYAAGEEERVLVRTKPHHSAEETAVEVGQLQGIKNTPKADARITKRERAPPIGRKITETEILCATQNLPLFHLSMEPVWASTGPPEERYVTRKRCAKPSADTSDMVEEIIEAHNNARASLPPERQFTTAQCFAFERYYTAEFNPDKVQCYEMRPPELLDVTWNSYWQIVARTVNAIKGKKPMWDPYILSGDVFSEGLICMRRKRVLLRPAFFYEDRYAEIRDAFDARCGSDVCQDVRQLPYRVSAKLVAWDAKAAFLVPNAIAPRDGFRWLVHQILLTTVFEDESELYGNSLLDTANRLGCGPTMPNLRRCILEDLRRWPIGPTALWNVIRQSYDEIGVMNGDDQSRLYTMSVPVLISSLNDAHRVQWVKALKFINSRQEQVEIPAWGRLPGQSDASWNEQQKSRDVLFGQLQDIRKHACPVPERWYQAQLILLMGPPGAGKTHILLHVMLECRRLGIPCQITSSKAQRALKLGGVHIHELFGFKAKHGAVAISESGLATLRQQPWRVQILQELQVLLIDEFADVGADLMLAVDRTLRILRGNPRPFGGVTVFGGGDHYQLPAVNMRSTFKAHLVRNNFVCLHLQHMVRATDPVLQHFITTMRKALLSEEDIAWVLNFLGRCPRVTSIPEWAHVTMATRNAIHHALEDVAQMTTERIYRFRAMDKVKTWQGYVDIPANTEEAEHADALLSSQTELPSQVVLIENWLTRISKNYDKKRNLLNGAVGTLTSAVGANASDAAVTLTLEDGKHVTIRYMESHEVLSKSGKYYKRFQVPLEVAKFLTVHDLQGLTVDKIFTSLCSQTRSYLWDRTQLLTIVSRVHTPAGLNILPGNLALLEPILRRRKRMAGRIDSWIASVDMLEPPATRPHLTVSVPPSDNMHAEPLHYVDASEAPYNCVYILQSKPRPTMSKVGSAYDLQKRLKLHNSLGGGTRCTLPSYTKPWVLVAYVCGFPSHPPDEKLGRELAYNFETEHRKVPTAGGLRDVLVDLDIAVNLIRSWNRRGHNFSLRLETSVSQRVRRGA